MLFLTYAPAFSRWTNVNRNLQIIAVWYRTYPPSPGVYLQTWLLINRESFVDHIDRTIYIENITEKIIIQIKNSHEQKFVISFLSKRKWNCNQLVDYVSATNISFLFFTGKFLICYEARLSDDHYWIRFV